MIEFSGSRKHVGVFVGRRKVAVKEVAMEIDVIDSFGGCGSEWRLNRTLLLTWD